jgi:hypothetical protein
MHSNTIFRSIKPQGRCQTLLLPQQVKIASSVALDVARQMFLALCCKVAERARERLQIGMYQQMRP